MIKIGMLIGDRYEIMEKIGTGGMSDVYKAKCHKLNRFVAVKVLKQEFSENTNFVSKFRIEAQAAAGLMHPNIVNVYDVGEDEGIYYIVMELVDGITLKKYIEKKARLSVKEAISIAIQISLGIEAAHNNHIIHRDIKPQNIIISKEGKVKVTDFGIAKAATSNTITSNVMGSVHYTSPEQARGGYSDEKSDIYSLGITLFEMLTGRVPFNGETTVAIAIKHIQEPMPSPRDFVPEIPLSIEQIVLKSTQKSPDKRYQSMVELVEDLKRSLVTPDEDFVRIIDDENYGGTKVVAASDAVQIKRSSSNLNTEKLRLSEAEKAQKERLAQKQQLKHTGAIKHVKETNHSQEADELSEEDDFDPRVEKITTIIVIAIAVLIGILVLVLVARWAGVFGGKEEVEEIVTEQTDTTDKETDSTTEEDTTEDVKVTMIDVTGMNFEDAKLLLTELGLIVKANYEESDVYEKDLVMNSDIEKDQKVSKSSTVTLTVSSGKDGVEVPDIIGRSSAEGVSVLNAEGFTVNKTEAYSSTVAKGNIISQSPEPGIIAPKNSAVTIIISMGREVVKTRIPNLLGLTDTEAAEVLTGLGLDYTWGTPEYNTTYAEGLICYQSYPEGSYVENNVSVTLRISKGAEPITYYYNVGVTKPTDARYTEGTVVEVKLIGSDGKELFNQPSVTSFPVSINIRNLPVSSGTIYLTYEVQVYSFDNNGNSAVTKDTIEEKRDVTFTQE